MVIITVVIFTQGNFYKGMKEKTSLQRNDIVLLKKEYKRQYPHISLGRPMRVVSTDGNHLTVTFMATKDIASETINVGAVKKVS
jgi:hypothetical protein